jgi:hypothetical protein
MSSGAPPASFAHSGGSNPAQMGGFFSAEFFQSLAPELRAVLEGKAAEIDAAVPVTSKQVLDAAQTAMDTSTDIVMPTTLKDVIQEAAEMKTVGFGEGMDDGTIQTYLDENANHILAISELQTQNRFEDALPYQRKLQKNLLFLAALADLAEV